MADDDQVYGDERRQRLVALLHEIARHITVMDRAGRLLERPAELIRLLGEARSELFHYEVRRTYDTPEVAEHRRLVEEALRPPELTNPDDEEDEPWRGPSRT